MSDGAEFVFKDHPPALEQFPKEPFLAHVFGIRIQGCVFRIVGFVREENVSALKEHDVSDSFIDQVLNRSIDDVLVR